MLPSQVDDVNALSYRAKPPIYPAKERGVVKCSSYSFKQLKNSSGLFHVKTRSRLIDTPPTFLNQFTNDESASSGFFRKSGGGAAGKDRDGGDEDPFLDDDLPDDFKKPECGMFATVQWASLVLILGALACSLSLDVLKRQTIWNLHLWKWEFMLLSLACGRLFCGWVIRVLVFFIERNFLLRKRLLYFVHEVRIAVQNCLWLGLVLLTWHYMFDDKVDEVTKSDVSPKVTKVFICLLVTTLIWLVKTLLVKVLASSFHVSTYFDRIQESLFTQYVIETLSGPPLVEIYNNREEEEASVRSRRKSGDFGNRMRARLSSTIGRKENSKQNDAISIDHLHKLNQKNVSAWNMKRLMRIVRNGALTTLDEQSGSARGYDEESAMEIKSEFQAKIAAKNIFNNVAKPGSMCIYLKDLMRFMREDEARKTMSLFEGVDEIGQVSKKCLKDWVVNSFRERKALALTLNDTKTAVKTLHKMANVIVGAVVLTLTLLILNIASTHFFVFAGSQLLVAVCMFGNTLKMGFEAVIFLFVVHPFDVGDLCEIEGVELVVEEMHILTTVFLRGDNQKITYPNSVLATKPIGNFYRSPDMGDSIDFCVHVSTPWEKLAIMKERIIGYMESKKDHWYPAPAVVLTNVDDMNRLKISIWMRQRINFQDMGARWERRELVLKEMIKVLKELGIEYRMLPLDVNVRNMAANSNASPRLPSNWSTCP